MIKTLRESKAKLSELVEQASRGEDVLITVRGKVKARLTRAEKAGSGRRQGGLAPGAKGAADALRGQPQDPIDRRHCG